ncbi:MAG: hypothetical protein GC156_04310 [Actinomycetales bacterium]|nr:hypothetical protein [Actinomycetales bacterium]
MNIRPSTPQVLRDLAEELNREVMPLLTDSTDQIRLHMIMAVLGQCAVRAGSEIDLMKLETADYRAYSDAVATVTGDRAVRDETEAIGNAADLTLEAVVAEYTRASEAFATALEAAMDAGATDLVERGEELLRKRIANEQLMAEVASAGR